MLSDDHTSIELPTHILEKVDDEIEDTNFSSRSEFIQYTLIQVLNALEDKSDQAGGDQISEEEVEDRLASLGYLDK